MNYHVVILLCLHQLTNGVCARDGHVDVDVPGTEARTLRECWLKTGPATARLESRPGWRAVRFTALCTGPVPDSSEKPS